VFLKNFERRSRSGIFRASYLGDLSLVPRPGIHLFWPKVFLFFHSRWTWIPETACETYSYLWMEVWKRNWSILCYDVTVFTGMVFSGRIFKHRKEFFISIRSGKLFIIWTDIMLNKYSDFEGG